MRLLYTKPCRLKIFSAIFAQQQFKLNSPPLPETPAADDLVARPISQVVRRSGISWRYPQLPNPDTPDNHIYSNDYGIGPIAPTAAPAVSASRQLVPGSVSLLKRVAWPANFSCTPENGSVGFSLLSIAVNCD